MSKKKNEKLQAAKERAETEALVEHKRRRFDELSKRKPKPGMEKQHEQTLARYAREIEDGEAWLQTLDEGGDVNAGYDYLL